MPHLVVLAGADIHLMASRAIIPLTRMGLVFLTLVGQTLCFLLTLTHSGAVQARIFACQAAETVIYQDRPCPLEKPEPTLGKATSLYPLSIHESWFDLPEQAEERAFCDKRSCECGRIQKKHQGLLVQSVADALFLDGSWHRYETNLQAWLDSPPFSRQNHEFREQMLEASCEIMISQTLLRNYGQSVMEVLQQRARTAQRRGFDVKEPCLQGIPESCAYYDSVQLLSRIRADARALRRTRGESQLPGSADIQEPSSTSDEAEQ